MHVTSQRTSYAVCLYKIKRRGHLTQNFIESHGVFSIKLKMSLIKIFILLTFEFNMALLVALIIFGFTSR